MTEPKYMNIATLAVWRLEMMAKVGLVELSSIGPEWTCRFEENGYIGDVRFHAYASSSIATTSITEVWQEVVVQYGLDDPSPFEGDKS